MSTVLVTGANRGLGLGFCRQFASTGWRVIACCRNPEAADELAELKRQYQQLQIFPLDVENFSEIDTLSAHLSHETIDVLINNAGVYGDNKGQGFGQLDYQAWQRTLTINTMAPVKMAEAFFPQIKSSEKKLIVAISSLMGSIADNSSGGSLFYRSSKAALNAAMKTLAIDLSPTEVGVLIFHPGWVRTDMGGPNGLIGVDESVSGMIQLINDFRLEISGDFVKYEGMPMPW
jgi:NAD(P)-dependent dehydrogenase (short-subunit alcohol dehydrogenase family)